MSDLPPDDPWSTPLPVGSATNASQPEEAPADEWTPVTPIPDDVRGNFPRHRLGKPAAWWVYKDAAGHRLLIVCRFNLADGRKIALPLTYCRRKDGEAEWRWKALPTPRPLYGLDRLAARPKAPVIVCEGEKAADKAEARFPDYVAITSSNGAEAADKADWSPLAGRVVTVWPDHDEKGRAYAADVVRFALAAGAALVAVVTVPDAFPPKWDLADPLPEGWDDEGLRRLLHEAVPMALPQDQEEEQAEPTCEPGSDWPEPLPLVTKIEPAAYPLNVLPPTIRAAVEEVHAFVKAPLPLVASSALGALSLAVQASADVKRAEKLEGPIGLFLLTIADSGERKSTCDGFFSAAMRDYQERQAEAAKPLLAAYKADLSAWEAKRAATVEAIKTETKAGKDTSGKEAALRDLEIDKPTQPKVPRLLRGDDTPENLAWVLAREWPSAGIISSEAGIVFGSHGMGKDSVMRNLALLNILWDGGTLSVGRRTSESFEVKGARLTMHLQVQAATLRDFFERSGALARGTGFLARFLVACPPSTQGMRPFTDPPEHWPALAAFNRRLTAILEQPVAMDEAGSLVPPVLPLSPEAKALWVTFHDAIEGELASGGELYDVRDVASKSADNAARLAALFQLFEHGAAGAVGRDAFESASCIVAWHLSEARRFFHELALSPELVNAMALDDWLLEICRRERTTIVPTREVQRCGPNALRKSAAFEAAMGELSDLGRARLVKAGKRKIITINPALLAQGGAA